jgi:hypothetical protein
MGHNTVSDVIIMEDAQKKAKRVCMPIANVKLVMMVLAAVLTAQHFLQEVNDWEGLLDINGTWRAWKVGFHLAHLKRQCQLQASRVGGPLGSAHAATPDPTFPGNYCWTHGHQCSQHHMSATCSNKAAGHKDDAIASNTMGGSNANKG